jgi:teichoic acid transport system permease protein
MKRNSGGGNGRRRLINGCPLVQAGEGSGAGRQGFGVGGEVGIIVAIMSTLTVDDRARLSGWRSYVRDLWDRREFAWFLAMGNLKARNASTALGLFWWVLNPLLMATVYFIVFGLIFPRSGSESFPFLSWLLSGIFAFTYTTTAMTSGANSILANSKLLVNIRFPRMILPLSALVEAAVGFLAALGIFYVLAWPFNDVGPSRWLVVLPLAFVLHTAMNLGLAALTARLAVPFRDINNFIPHFTRLWLYLSPIIWQVTFLDGKPDWAVNILQLNPMWGVLSLYRTALMGSAFEMSAVISTLVWIAILGVGGVISFVRFEGNMVRHL